MKFKESHITIYSSLFLLLLIITLLLYILKNEFPIVNGFYMIFKVFFLVIFVLYMHKYLNVKYRKLLNLDDIQIEDEKDFNQGVIENLFKGW